MGCGQITISSSPKSLRPAHILQVALLSGPCCAYASLPAQSSPNTPYPFLSLLLQEVFPTPYSGKSTHKDSHCF